jgi:hypothetical protein
MARRSRNGTTAALIGGPAGGRDRLPPPEAPQRGCRAGDPAGSGAGTLRSGPRWRDVVQPSRIAPLSQPGKTPRRSLPCRRRGGQGCLKHPRTEESRPDNATVRDKIFDGCDWQPESEHLSHGRSLQEHPVPRIKLRPSTSCSASAPEASLRVQATEPDPSLASSRACWP